MGQQQSSVSLVSQESPCQLLYRKPPGWRDLVWWPGPGDTHRGSPQSLSVENGSHASLVPHCAFGGLNWTHENHSQCSGARCPCEDGGALAWSPPDQLRAHGHLHKACKCLATI